MMMQKRILPALLVLLAAACGPAAPPPASVPAVVTFTTPPPAGPVTAAEHATRRAALMERTGDGVLIVFGSQEPVADYLPYAQNANFRYLTGVVEAGATLVMVREGGRLQERLFVQPRNPAREIWEGARLGPEGATALTGIPAAPHDRMLPAVDSLLQRHRVLHTLLPLPAAGALRTPEQQILETLLARHAGVEHRDQTAQVRRLRALKSPTEIDLIRRAVQVSVLAHREAMRSTRPGMNEFEIQALVEYFFRRNGAERPAYSSIVGSGPNATTLHYRDADRFMQAGELLLMDVGASYRGYAADVTRTFPVGGTFSPRQREIYEIVLGAQIAAEQLARPGSVRRELDEAANRVISNGLARIGLIDAPDATYDCPQGRCPQSRIFYMHGLGHGVGLDVHDPDTGFSYGEPFQVGNAFTIEPGIYVRADAFDYLQETQGNREMIARLRPALDRYRDIGVRIEDVYFITETGSERVSAGAPRGVTEIEALMREQGIGELQRRPDVIEWYRLTEPRTR
jgi:Xaa-Pro aminopeptidase